MTNRHPDRSHYNVLKGTHMTFAILNTIQTKKETSF